MLKKIAIILSILLISLCTYTVGYSLNEGEETSIVQKTPSPRPQKIEISETELFGLVNNQRNNKSLKSLTWDQNLCSYANRRALEIATNFSHEGFYKMSDEMYKNLSYNHIAENLAENIYMKKSIVDAWLESPTHRENIEGQYSHSCIQCKGTYCVQLFASY